MEDIEISAAAVRIVTVDDHEVVREGLRSTLAGVPGYQVVGVAGSGAEALAVVRETRPDVVLLDLRLPDAPGDVVCRRLLEAAPEVAVLMLTTYLSEASVRTALQAGAAGYVTKGAGLAELRRAIDSVAAGEARPTPVDSVRIVQALHGAIERGGGASITPQQERVLDLAARGLTNQQIGAELFLSESTVRFHLQKLKAKLGVRTKTELVATAIRGGYVAPTGSDDPR